MTWLLCKGHTLSGLCRLHDNSFSLRTWEEKKSVNIAPCQYPSMVGWSLSWLTPSGAHSGRDGRGCQHTTPRGKVNAPLLVSSPTPLSWNTLGWATTLDWWLSPSSGLQKMKHFLSSPLWRSAKLCPIASKGKWPHSTAEKSCILQQKSCKQREVKQ